MAVQFDTQRQRQMYRRVGNFLHQVYGSAVYPLDDYPGFALAWGSTSVQVGVAAWGEGETFVNLRCHVASVPNARRRGDLLHYLLERNNGMYLEKFGLDGDHIVLECAILGSLFAGDALQTLITTVGNTADEADDEIVGRWGGMREWDKAQQPTQYPTAARTFNPAMRRQATRGGSIQIGPIAWSRASADPAVQSTRWDSGREPVEQPVDDQNQGSDQGWQDEGQQDLDPVAAQDDGNTQSWQDEDQQNLDPDIVQDVVDDQEWQGEEQQSLDPGVVQDDQEDQGWEEPEQPDPEPAAGEDGWDDQGGQDYGQEVQEPIAAQDDGGEQQWQEPGQQYEEPPADQDQGFDQGWQDAPQQEQEPDVAQRLRNLGAGQDVGRVARGIWEAFNRRE